MPVNHPRLSAVYPARFAFWQTIIYLEMNAEHAHQYV